MKRFCFSAVTISSLGLLSMLWTSPPANEVQFLTDAESAQVIGGDLFCYNDIHLVNCPAEPTFPSTADSCADLICVGDGAGGFRCPQDQNQFFMEDVQVNAKYSDSCLTDMSGVAQCATDLDWWCHTYRLCNGACAAPNAQGVRKCGSGNGIQKFNKQNYKYPQGDGCSQV
jgi:hypothetical protein